MRKAFVLIAAAAALVVAAGGAFEGAGNPHAAGQRLADASQRPN